MPNGPRHPPQKALVDQLGDELVGGKRSAVGGRTRRLRAASWPAVTGDPIGRGEGEAAVEYGQATEKDLRSLARKFLTPGDRGAKRLLPLWEIAGAAGQNVQEVIEATKQFVEGAQFEARRRQLDRQRQTVEPAANCRHLHHIRRREREIWEHRSSALDKELHRRRSRDDSERRLRHRVGQPQRLDRKLLLVPQTQGHAARHQEPQLGAIGQQVGDQVTRRRQRLLEVVKQQEPAPGAERLEHAAAKRAHVALAEAERVGDGRDDLRRVDAERQGTTVTPAGNAFPSNAASAPKARWVLPTPPGPVRVRSRTLAVLSRVVIAASASSRPTSALVGAGNPASDELQDGGSSSSSRS